jgi:alpha-tubulin suppressor-like RCC1 family protein
VNQAANASALRGGRHNNLISGLLALAICLIAMLAVGGQQANAEQGGTRVRQVVGARMDSSTNHLGPNHTCAIQGNGKLYCWGSNTWGQLGYGNVSTVGETNVPRNAGAVSLGSSRIAVAVATAGRSTCVILDNGTVKCWGLNSSGQLGYGNTENIGDNETPSAIDPVDLGAGRTATAIAGGGDHFCAILDNGTVRCWGTGSSGELGYGNTQAIGDNETPGSVGPVDLGAGRTAVAITAGTLHTCAILDNGSVRCWGHNTSGELGVVGGPYIGDNETPGSVAPVELGAGRTAVAIGAGESNSCAILDNGTLKCWGSNSAGKLGYATTAGTVAASSAGAVNLGAGRSAVSISLGALHTCATLDDGSVKCWGSTDWGELGYGNTPKTGGGAIGDNETPAAVGSVDVGAGRKAVAISASDYFTCAMLDDGKVRCWGLDSDGHLGYGTGPYNPMSPNVIGDDETPGSAGPIDFGTNTGPTQVAAGGAHSCALFSTGMVRCWGSGASGQLGYGDTQNIGDDENVGVPSPVETGGNPVELAAGANHTCALLPDGTVRCWGLNASGQLGIGNTNTIGDNELPTSVAVVDLGGKKAIQIAAGKNHTCALLAEGAIRCWGLNSSGQLGYGHTTTIGDNEAPGSAGPVSLGGSAASISAGGVHTCAHLADGAVRCWGSGSSGRLGYGNTVTIGDGESPSGVSPVSVGGSASALSLGGSHTCALQTNGAIRCWGLNSNGQLGYANTLSIGDNELPSTAGPTALGVNALAVVLGETHSCAVQAERAVRCWGLNTDGQLGIASTTTIGDNEEPGSVAVVNLGSNRTVLNLAAGGHHTCAVLNNATVRCWGLNSSGQLGIRNTNTIGDNESPTSSTVDFEDEPPFPIEDSASLPEDSPATQINVLANDWDSDGGPKRVETATNGTHGTVAITAGGSAVTYLPDPNYCGSDSFKYTVNGTAWTATVSIAVTCVDDPPVAVDDSASVKEDSVSNVVNVTANDTDIDAGPKAIASKSEASHGSTAIISGGLDITYTPDANYCGADSLTYTLNGGSTATVSISVTCVDDSPTAANDAATVAEDANGAPINVLANDPDIDGGPKEIASRTNGGHGTVAITGGGSGLAYTPEANYCGSDSFTYTLNGGSTATVSVAVSCVDDPPLAVKDSATLTEDAGAKAIDVLVNDTDIDAGAKSIASKTNGSNGTVTIIGGGTELTYAPNADYCGSDSFTYTLNGGSTATVSVTITCVDDMPVAVNDSATIAEDATATAINVLANDTDIDGGPKTVASKTNGAHGTVVITGSGAGLTYQPDANYCGPDSFAYTLNGGSTATVSVTISCVDDMPAAVNDSATVSEDVSAASVDVLANDTDIDGGPKTVASKTNGNNGTVAITGSGTGVSYTPAANYCGPDSFTYTLNGGSTATVSVTISCVDDAPTAVSDTDTLTEDSGPDAIDVLANDTDIDGGPKTVSSKTNGNNGTVAITGGGTGVSYTPATNYCGPDSFSYTLNGGSQATVSVVVSCVDDSPLAVDDFVTVPEDAGAFAINVLANDTDVDGGTKTVASRTNGAHGTVAIDGEGSGLSYTPVTNYCGPDSFTYTLNGGSQATVSITVNCVDDPPVAVNDSRTVEEDSQVEMDVLTNDTDIDGGAKKIESKTNGAHGTVVITEEGAALRYQPAANYCGPDSFTYTLNGGSTATVSMTVVCLSDAPVAVNDSATLSEDASATPIDVLANDSDADGGVKAIASKTNGDHGTVAITGSGSGLSYTPSPDYCGQDSFSYTLNGGSTASVSVTITCVDDLPTAANDSATVGEDASASSIDVLTNDPDPDQGPKTIASKTNGAHGTVAITGSGAGLTYLPAANYCGPDSFTYTLNGGSTATVSITVTCVDDTPTAVNDADTVVEDSGLNAVDVLANDTDADGGPKAISGRTNGAHGTVAIIGAGAALTYAPAADFCGSDSFTYTLNGGSQATVSITVTCVDDPPPPPPPVEGGSSGGQSSTTIVQPPQGSSAPVVNITPGIGVVSGRRRPRVAVKGSFAFFTLTCKHSDKDCAGTVTVTANIPSVALGPAQKVTLVKGKFRIAAGRSVLVRAKLTKVGLEVLRKRSLRGVGARMGIVDSGNGESGKIEVNLVRRPKASLLPSGGK